MGKRTNASKLRNKVEIQKNQTIGVNDANEQVDNWITIRKCWSEVLAVGSREYYSAVELQFETTHSVLIREGVCNTESATSITQGCRVIWGDRILSVDGVLRVDDNGRYLRLSCTEDTRQ